MDNFKNPYIDKLIGPHIENKDSKINWHEYIINNIEIIGGEKINNFEIVKTKVDIDIISYVESQVDKMLESYGRSKVIALPLNNIHLLNSGGTEMYTKGRLSHAAHSSLQQSIIVDRDISNIQFSLQLFHEMVHVKSYTAFQIISENKNIEQLQNYRNGLRVVSRDGKTVYLGNLEEAVVAYLTNQFYESAIKESSVYSYEMEKLNQGKLEFYISRQEELTQLEIFN